LGSLSLPFRIGFVLDYGADDGVARKIPIVRDFGEGRFRRSLGGLERWDQRDRVAL
jgi:hypothetical protein